MHRVVVAALVLLWAEAGPGQVWTPAGLAGKAREQWPWLRIGGELRSRVEAPTGLNFAADNDDSYLLTRIRLNTRVSPASWLAFFGEWQDVRGFGKDAPAPGSVLNRLDLRQAYVQVGATEGPGMGIRLGRQALKYGKGRLVWDPDWGNFGQVFDALRWTAAGRAGRVDVFASSVVTPKHRAFDRSDTSNMLYGIYGSVERWGRTARVEPYLLLKSNAAARNELGEAGALDVYTAGFRAFGAWRQALDWESEVAIQAGRVASRPVRAFGGVWMLGVATGRRAWQPRISATYTYGSGDRDSRDGKKSTFDTLYPSVHLRNGATDRVGWANLRDLWLQGDWRISKQWKLSGGGHDFRLVTTQDALYSPSGAALIRNLRATSGRLGWELFASADYQLSGAVILGAGYAHLFRGQFLRESGRCSVTQPYLFLTYRF